jgi:hypothetical protein
MNKTMEWTKTSQELPEQGRRVFFLTTGKLCGIGCLQYVKGQPVWYSEFAWGEFDANVALDSNDPEMHITYWTPLAPPPYPDE